MRYNETFFMKSLFCSTSVAFIGHFFDFYASFFQLPILLWMAANDLPIIDDILSAIFKNILMSRITRYFWGDF